MRRRAQLGTQNISEELARRVLLANQVSLIFMSVAIFYGISFFLFGFVAIGFGALAVAAVFYMVPSLAQRRMLDLSRFWLIHSCSLAVAIYSGILSYDSHLHDFYYSFAMVPFLIFRVTEGKKILVGFLTVYFYRLFLAEVYPLDFLEITLSHSQKLFYYYSFTAMTFVLIGVPAWIMVKSGASHEEKIRKAAEDSTMLGKLATLGEVAFGIGHEINNPLTIASSSMRVVQKLHEAGDYDNERIKKAFTNHQIATDRIKDIVLGIKNYSRLEVESAEFSVNKMLEETAGLLRGLYKKEGICIELDSCDKEYFVTGNRSKLNQCIMNLMSNAADALEGRENKEIRLSLSEALGVLRLGVLDNGLGIKDEDKSKILEAFFTTKPVGKGTGLGLSITTKLVKENEGKLYFDSTYGKGTCFYIELNLSRKESKDLPVESAS